MLVSGLYVKKVDTKYGEIIKQSFDLEEFYKFAKENKVKGKNGKDYLNVDILTNKEGQKYARLDDWKPESKEDDLPY